MTKQIDIKDVKFKQFKSGDSWYKCPPLTKQQENYLTMIENTFRIQMPNRQWEFIKLQPHQRHYHSLDLSIQGDNAKHTIVTKSRNTSFTINSVIRILTGVYAYRDTDIPLVRLNEEKVKELLLEFKKLIKHVRPIKLENGDLWPFDPSKTILNNSLRITFPDRGVVLRSFPAASPNSAESIRGLRICAGLVDEANFLMNWDSIRSSIMHAGVGFNDEGKRSFQVSFGTTLKGRTPFYQWLENTDFTRLTNYNLLRWPVFDPKVFNPNIEPMKQPKLIPIVYWHQMNALNNAYLEDKKAFNEELMAIFTPGADAYYPMDLIYELSTLENNDDPKHEVGKEYFMGIDPSGKGSDFMSIRIISRKDGFVKDEFKYNVRIVDDPEKMLAFIVNLIRRFNPTKVRVDSSDLGYYYGTQLSKIFGGNVIEVLRGAVRIKANKNFTIPLKEYMHTNLKRLIVNKKIRLIMDELTINHFSMWKDDYSAERTRKDGHGDAVIALALATLPRNFRLGGRSIDFKPKKQDSILSNDEVRNEIKKFQVSSFKDRMKFYKDNKGW